MDLEVSLQLLLRLLPSIILVALAFIAASDRKTRERWTDLLYQAGSLRPEQRSDARIQSKVKWPFLIMAAILLIGRFAISCMQRARLTYRQIR
jgi:hypothetical protein